MAFDRMREVVSAVAARRGVKAGRALELHAKAMITIVHFEGYFKKIGDTQKAQLADSLMDVVMEMGVAMGVTEADSRMIAEATAGDISDYPASR